MKTSPKQSDPLFESITGETIGLPLAGAAFARHRRRRRTQVIRAGAGGLFLAFSIGVGFFRHQAPKETVRNNIAAPAPPAFTGYVKVYRANETPDANSIPPDATEREKQLFEEFRGAPLLIVKDKAGQIASIHIFER